MFFDHLARIRVIEPLPAEYSVGGPDLTESSTGEKLANAKTMSEINKNGEAGGPIFTSEEIRTTAGHDATPVGELPPTPDDQDITDDEPLPLADE